MKERELLTHRICESVIAIAPSLPLVDFFKLRRRLLKTDVRILRSILEEDVVNVTAAQFVREAVAR